MRQFLALSRLLNRPGRLADKDFEPSPDLLGLLAESARVLVVGAGGLGCELLKNLALLGFGRLDVIDMDTIDLSNLNRQFLFAQGDIGRSKATVAAEVIEKRVPHCRVTAHHCRIQDRDAEFYRQFHVVVCGLDSVVARRWINGRIFFFVVMSRYIHYSTPGPALVGLAFPVCMLSDLTNFVVVCCFSCVFSRAMCSFLSVVSFVSKVFASCRSRLIAFTLLPRHFLFCLVIIAIIVEPTRW